MTATEMENYTPMVVVDEKINSKMNENTENKAISSPTRSILMETVRVRRLSGQSI